MYSIVSSEVLATVLSAPVQAAIVKALLNHFRPDLQNNNWRNALIVSGVNVAISLESHWAGAIAFLVLCVVLYRVSLVLTFGIGILVGIIMSGLVFCLSLGLAIHPLVPVGVGAVCAAIVLPLRARARSQRKRMQVVWQEGTSASAVDGI